MIPTELQIKQAVLKTYRVLGRTRIPLPGLICFVMREVGTNDSNYLEHFQAIHKFVRSNWGNDGLLSRRRGIKGGIKIRDKVKL